MEELVGGVLISPSKSKVEHLRGSLVKVTVALSLYISILNEGLALET